MGDDADFRLHERLAADTVQITDWPLSSVRLMNDRSWPWLILVPRRAALREMHDLATLDLALLVGEIAKASRAMTRLCKPEKVNIGALGNLVPQLHIHVIGRFRDDPAWPGPVWSFRPAVPYRNDELDLTVERLRAALQ